MTLHEAIIKVLIAANRSMTTSEIAVELNKTKAYHKKDGSLITNFQIHSRTRNYSHLFDRNKTLVDLKGRMKESKLKPETKNVREIKSNLVLKDDINFQMITEPLLDSSSFKSAKNIDKDVPSVPGIYCIRIKDIKSLPKPFNTELKKRNHNIIYIGIATQSLKKRMLNQELRANGHGTFFRSLGAVLGYRPPINSLVNMKNKRNFKFSTSDEDKIIEWINTNLWINWIEQISTLEEIETTLIRKYKPILNLAKNPEALIELSGLRKQCVDIANGN